LLQAVGERDAVNVQLFGGIDMRPAAFEEGEQRFRQCAASNIGHQLPLKQFPGITRFA
jgi:hypothetical protein